MPKKHALCDNTYISMGQECKESKCIKCQFLEEPECRFCHDTGSITEGLLDCHHCNAGRAIELYEILQEQKNGMS